jgi:hypothetical protein
MFLLIITPGYLDGLSRQFINAEASAVNGAP